MYAMPIPGSFADTVLKLYHMTGLTTLDIAQKLTPPGGSIKYTYESVMAVLEEEAESSFDDE